MRGAGAGCGLDTGETARRERERSTPFRTTMAVARRTASGHKGAFPRRRLNARCQFSQETFAGVRSNGQDAPIADLIPNSSA